MGVSSATAFLDRVLDRVPDQPRIEGLCGKHGEHHDRHRRPTDCKLDTPSIVPPGRLAPHPCVFAPTPHPGNGRKVTIGDPLISVAMLVLWGRGTPRGPACGLRHRDLTKYTARTSAPNDALACPPRTQNVPRSRRLTSPGIPSSRRTSRNRVSGLRSPDSEKCISNPLGYSFAQTPALAAHTLARRACLGAVCPRGVLKAHTNPPCG